MKFKTFEFFCYYSGANTAAVLKGASHHENLVYQIISEAGNKGEPLIVAEVFLFILKHVMLTGFSW
jgi:hypothetical protein